jgi:hypothetical protein
MALPQLDNLRPQREAPPSVLSDISPTRGEIAVRPLSRLLATSKEEGKWCRERSLPSRERCPTGQRGALGANLSRRAPRCLRTLEA